MRNAGPQEQIVGPLAQGIFDTDACCLSLAAARDLSADADRLPPWALRGIVDDLNVGVVVIEDDWRVAYANRAAAVMLSVDVALTIESGRLVIRPEAVAERFRAWLACSGSPRAVVAVARASGRPSALFEYLSPLAGVAGNRLHVLAMLDAGQPPRVDPDRLAVAFGLTRAEARLMASLATGETLQGFAQRQGITVATVRSHFESVCAKTGARRQSQVVRLAMACAAPIARVSDPAQTTPPDRDGRQCRRHAHCDTESSRASAK
jgi:DNA-binding CsgD family transcriptional regulator